MVKSSAADLIRPWLWSLLGTLPYLSIYFFHWSCFGPAFSGFVQSDMPYYAANGRAIFERGTLLLYPNPFDYSSDAPSIYFHLLPLLLGIGIKLLHLDPGYLSISLGVLFGLILARLTYSFCHLRLSEDRFSIFSYLFLIWGGGIFFWISLLFPTFQADMRPAPGAVFLMRLEPFYGWWFQNWGRNIVLFTEAFYHCIAIGLWLSLLQRRWLAAGLLYLSIAICSPWTGAQVLSTISLWLALERLLRNNRTIPAEFQIFAAAILLGFAGYYFGYLKSFEAHRRITEHWSYPWVLQPSQNFCAYFIVFIPAAINLIRSRRNITELQTLFISLALCSAALENHDLLFPPIQPLHFTRGYLWFAAAAIGLAEVERLCVWIRTRSGPTAAAGLLSGLLLFSSADNLAFVGTLNQTCSLQVPLNPALRAVFEFLGDGQTGKVLLCSDNDDCTLAATYTSARPYLGHWYLTPEIADKMKSTRELFEEGRAGEWFEHVDLLLVKRSRWTNLRDTLPPARVWNVAYSNSEYLLLARTEEG